MPARRKSSKAPSGSPPYGEPEYLLVGTVRRPHGLRGEMLMEVVTDFPERIKAELRVFVGELHEPLMIVASRAHNDGVLIKFGGTESQEAAGKYRNQSVYVASADRPPLPQGYYYHHELIGSEVVDDANKVIGVLGEILQTGANDVYVVQTPAGGQVLLPVVASVVLQIDPDRHTIRVRVPEGLEPD